MPLYWSTDKIIAGKYRLKKPIPIKNIGYTKWFDDDITFDIKVFNKTFEIISFYEFEIEIFSELEETLSLQQRDYKQYENNGYTEEQFRAEDNEFIKKIMEYLEEIK